MPGWNEDENADDALHRGDFKHSLNSIISMLDGKATVVLDGPWGAGKTHFIRNWIANDEFKALYFDAFACDYFEDPFVPLCAAILEQTPGHSAASRKFAQASMKVFGGILKATLRATVKYATHGLVDTTNVSEAAKSILNELQGEVADGAADVIYSELAQSVDAYVKGKLQFKEFRDCLTALVRECSGGKTFVFVVDELDRCRPSFAVQLVETIKHLFDVDKVVFLLVVNEDQLSDAFAVEYGCNVHSAAKYIRKFVDLRLEFPRNGGQSGHKLGDLFQSEVDRVLSRVTNNTDDNVAMGLKKAISFMVDNGPATARDIKQIAILVGLMHGNQTPVIRDKRYCDIVAMLIVLSVVAPAMFRRLCEVPHEFSHANGIERDKAWRQLGLYYHPEHVADADGDRLRVQLRGRFEALAGAMQGNRTLHLQDIDPIDVGLIVNAVKSIPLNTYQ